MVLKKIDKDISEEIRNNGKKIICYVKVPEYIREMDEKFGLLNLIDCILEEHEKRLGICECEGVSIPVYSAVQLNEIDWRQYALVITSEYYREVFDMLQKNENVKKGMSTVYYYADAEIEHYDYYADFYKEEALENVIIFRSGPRNGETHEGMDFDDNARALFEYMLAEGFNKKYRLVWLVKDPSRFDEYTDYLNVSFISMDWAISEIAIEREQYYRPLCTAKYIFFTNAFSFVRNARKEQVRVQLWHGQGFKARAIGTVFETKCEYMTVMSQFYAGIHEKIFGLKHHQLLITGNPKQDWMFHKVEKEKLRLLGIPDSKKYIFWLPTFRKATQGWERFGFDASVWVTGMPVIKNFEQADRLNDLLMKNDMMLIIKHHPAQDESRIADIGRSNIFLLKQERLAREKLHINQLLGYADALISDYSSVAVDYLLLDRPIAFAIDDMEEYKKGRGFVFDNIEDWLPGKELFTFEHLCDFVDEIAMGVDSSWIKRQEISAKMCKWKDDRNCERVLEALGITKND